MEGIESNLDKKYKYYTITCSQSINSKKQVSTKIQMHDTDVIVIGPLWEMGFSNDIDESVQVFALDCGLGERNSLGFGFVNELSTP